MPTYKEYLAHINSLGLKPITESYFIELTMKGYNPLTKSYN